MIACCLALAQMSMARDVIDQINTGNPSLDSLLIAINRSVNYQQDSVVDRLSARVYVKGTSQNLQIGKTGKYLTNILPFEAHKGRTTAFESVYHISYQNPCQLQFTPVALRTNYKRGAKFLRESFQVLLPVYSFKESDENKSYVLPFTDEGLDKYDFDQKIDTIASGDSTLYVIYFSPKHEHHSLGTGYIKVGDDFVVRAMMFSGRVDFGKVDSYMTFELDKQTNTITPRQSHASISYVYGGNKGVNEFDTYLEVEDLSFRSRKRSRTKDNLDLTDVLSKKFDKENLNEVRPIPLSPEEDSLLTNVVPMRTKRRSLFQRLPEMLVGSNNFNAFGTDMKIYGPLDPASFSYDKINGFSFRQRLRFSHMSDIGRSIGTQIDVGYSFGMKELRYNTSFEYIYNPRKRGGIKLTAAKRGSGFSSKFKDKVNEVLSDTSSLRFEDLGIAYYRRHEMNIEHSYELLNGLMLYNGISYNYRDPVRHGSRAVANTDKLLKKHYAEFSPYFRLTWTPRQYYHYKNNQKLYIASYYPTFSFEMARGIKHVLGSTSDFGRMEFDVHQTIRLDAMRSISYRAGTGFFFRQKGEYFINYAFFARSTFPSTWNDHIGGVFSLMDDYWYNSTSQYFQSHVMFETPFLILHKAKAISKYVIKERIYMSHLWGDTKHAYSEIGFGMGNNYFNIGLFSSFNGLQINEVGLKATIEIDSHW